MALQETTLESNIVTTGRSDDDNDGIAASRSMMRSPSPTSARLYQHIMDDKPISQIGPISQSAALGHVGQSDQVLYKLLKSSKESNAASSSSTSPPPLLPSNQLSNVSPSSSPLQSLASESDRESPNVKTESLESPSPTTNDKAKDQATGQFDQDTTGKTLPTNHASTPVGESIIVPPPSATASLNGNALTKTPAAESGKTLLPLQQTAGEKKPLLVDAFKPIASATTLPQTTSKTHSGALSALASGIVSPSPSSSSSPLNATGSKLTSILPKTFTKYTASASPLTSSPSTTAYGKTSSVSPSSLSSMPLDNRIMTSKTASPKSDSPVSPLDPKKTSLITPATGNTTTPTTAPSVVATPKSVAATNIDSVQRDADIASDSQPSSAAIANNSLNATRRPFITESELENDFYQSSVLMTATSALSKVSTQSATFNRPQIDDWMPEPLVSPEIATSPVAAPSRPFLPDPSQKSNAVARDGSTSSLATSSSPSVLAPQFVPPESIDEKESVVPPPIAVSGEQAPKNSTIMEPSSPLAQNRQGLHFEPAFDVQLHKDPKTPEVVRSTTVFAAASPKPDILGERTSSWWNQYYGTEIEQELSNESKIDQLVDEEVNSNEACAEMATSLSRHLADYRILLKQAETYRGNPNYDEREIINYNGMLMQQKKMVEQLSNSLAVEKARLDALYRDQYQKYFAKLAAVKTSFQTLCARRRDMQAFKQISDPQVMLELGLMHFDENMRHVSVCVEFVTEQGQNPQQALPGIVLDVIGELSYLQSMYATHTNAQKTNHDSVATTQGQVESQQPIANANRETFLQRE